MNRNRKHIAFLAAGLLLIATSECNGQTSGKIYLKNGKPTNARIQSMDASQVVATISGKKTTYPRWQFDYITFSDQPAPLARLQRLIRQGQYPEALQVLQQSKWGKPKANSRLEILYSAAKIKAELALAGNNLSNHSDAMKSVEDYLKKAGTAHYRVSDAMFLKSRLQLGQGQIDPAIATLDEFSKSTKGEVAFDAKLKQGILLLSADKLVDAKSVFEQAVGLTKRTGKDLTVAKLGIAAAQSGTSGMKEAEQSIRKLLENSDPDDHYVNSLAYNFLGTAFLKSGKPKAAEVAFLHTDLLFYNNPEAHSEALFRLATIWRNNGDTGRYTEAVQKLKKKYGGTYWSKKLGG